MKIKKTISLLLSAIIAAGTAGLLPLTTQAATTYYTAAQVAQHNTSSDCWLIVSGSVYNVTSFIPIHPGGNAIVPYCGTDATSIFDAIHGTTGTAANDLPTYLIGALETALTAPVITNSTSTQTTATIGWSGSTGGVAPITYAILRDGASVGTTTASTMTFTDTGLTPSTTYSYVVEATDSNAPTPSVADSAASSVTTLATVTTTTASLAAQDFGVVNYDTGLGILKGYTAGFGLTGATFAGVHSVVVKLYASSTLLQTNTATSKVGATLTGSDISSPFDVSGSFNYVTDGYWTNVRQAEYGQTLPATRVVATVTLADGQVVTAENDALTGDPTTIMPATPTSTLPMVSIASPKNNAHVSGTVTVTVNASDTSSAIAKVSLLIDGVFGLKASTSSPYTFTINTKLLSDGTHTLRARAVDAAGNVGTSTTVSILVNNSGNHQSGGGDDGNGNGHGGNNGGHGDDGSGSSQDD